MERGEREDDLLGGPRERALDRLVWHVLAAMALGLLAAWRTAAHGNPWVSAMVWTLTGWQSWRAFTQYCVWRLLKRGPTP